MPKYGFLVVEGPHDVELAYRLLTPFGLNRIRLEKDVVPFFKPLIPKEYPPDGDLMKRMGTPLFLSSATHTIAIFSAKGDSRLVETVQENLAILDDPTLLIGVGLLLDADRDKNVTPLTRYTAIREGMTKLGHPLPALPGTISSVQLRVGAYVLPDNANQGTLEDLLLECASAAYPNLLLSATNHVATAETDTSLDTTDTDEFQKPSWKNKALVASIASLLRPGKAIQVSIQDNRWLRDGNLQLPKIKAIQDFLKALFELP